jgi:hypothetical protein
MHAKPGIDIARTSWINTHEAQYISQPETRNLEGFGVALVSADKKQLPLYKDRTGGLWVAGKEGESFSVEVLVPGQGNFGVLIAVDGCNQQDGTPSRGDLYTEPYWVMNAPTYKGANITPGWSRPDGKAAQFVFAKPSESYVAQMGGGESNCGIVACKFVREYTQSYDRKRFLGGSSGLTTRGLGAGYGKEVEMPRTTVEFSPHHAAGHIEAIIRYAPLEELERAGFTKIEPYSLPSAAQARPFAAESLRPGERTAPPPPGWRP